MRARPVTHVKQPAILPESPASPAYDGDCRRCARLATFLDAGQNPVFLPPGPAVRCPGRVARHRRPCPEHGANASGRPFTGDHAGTISAETLHAYGRIASGRDRSRRRTELIDCRITNAVNACRLATSRASRDPRLQRLPPISPHRPPGRDPCSAASHDATLAALGRSRRRSCCARLTICLARGVALTAIIAAATTRITSLTAAMFARCSTRSPHTSAARLPPGRLDLTDASHRQRRSTRAS